MSVFSDFQRMWVEKFPESSLSDAWEQDVRQSLARHRQRIVDLQKELEQETLYVEYLERLLSDVEKFRQSGGDPQTLIEASTPTGAAAAALNALSHSGSGSDVTSTTTAEPQTPVATSAPPPRNTGDEGEEEEDDKDQDVGVDEAEDGQPESLNNTIITPAPGQPHSPVDEHISTTSKDTAPVVQLRNAKDDQLNKCISELSSSFRRNNASESIDSQQTAAAGAQMPSSTTTTTSNNNDSNNSQPRAASASHFVTVIEVKESVKKKEATREASATEESEDDRLDEEVTAGVGGGGAGEEEDTQSNGNATGQANTTDDESLAESGGRGGVQRNKSSDSSGFGSDGQSNVMRLINKNNAVLAASSNVTTSGGSVVGNKSSTFSANNGDKIGLLSSSPTAGGGAEVPKKRIPPRPPPKNIRRPAPVEPPIVPNTTRNGRKSEGAAPTESPSSSLERNMKPSDFALLRQKSSDALDLRQQHVDGRRATMLDEYNKKLKADSGIEAIKKSSPTSSFGKSTPPPPAPSLLGKSPTGSLSKSIQAPRSSGSPTFPFQGRESGGANVGSKESLSSTPGAVGAISERIKSYESISSLSSDNPPRPNSQNQFEGEPLYDQVPMEQNDGGEYVYVQAGAMGMGTNSSNESGGGGAGGGRRRRLGTGSSSSRDDLSNAGSTLPMNSRLSQASNLRNSIQMQQQFEPESPGRNSNYVNIDYFITTGNSRGGGGGNDEGRSSSVDSDGEGFAGPVPVLLRAISQDEHLMPNTPGAFKKLPTINSGELNSSGGSIDQLGIGGDEQQAGERSRKTTIKHIIKSIITSETFYVECLNKMMQYMKAIRATLTTSQPVISVEEFQTVFYKIDDLHEVHTTFLKALQEQLDRDDSDLLVGEIFKRLASQMHLYAAFLHNYGRAIDTVKKCGQNNTQFKEIVSNIILNSKMEQSLTLEDLLHKPVARVQKNSLVLTDLISATPVNHPDHLALKETQKCIRNFLSEFNIVQRKSDDKALRRLVKYSYIVELADGHRKLRHLFLFNDVICCCKYKASSSKPERFEFELKWSIPLRDIIVLSETTYDVKELNPVNILQLKTQASTLRDQIMVEEKEKSRVADKGRKKLDELERQLLLASPNLAFRINNRATNKTMTFFLSSEYERTQWIDSIISLQESCALPGTAVIHDIQQYITACQPQIQAEMGSILMRAGRDESLLVGDLHLTVQGLSGMDHSADLFVCVEIDSYGHYFRKAKTKLVCRTASPMWNESFVLELEGSGNMRVLLYEDHAERPQLKAQYVVKLSRSWLQEIPTPKMIRLNDTLMLNTVVKFVPGEVSLRRVPTSKPGNLFGVKMLQVLKREKRDIPFIISACIREVERRGMGEVGIYRVSGSASDLARLKKSFETNPYEAEQMLKEVDVHSVTGILKSYLRELPEALFTDLCYPKLVETFNKFSNFNEANRIKALQEIARELPVQNQATINHILDHLIRVHHQEIENKMSLHNLAMVFGPTLLRPGPTTGKQPKDGLESSTVDVMAQAGILYCFLQARLK